MKIIPLTNGFVAKVDDEDYEQLAKNKWHAKKSSWAYYACRQTTVKDANGNNIKNAFGNYKNTTLRMHRVVMNCPEGMEIDHLDGDTMNNQKHNLEIVTREENLRRRRYEK